MPHLGLAPRAVGGENFLSGGFKHRHFQLLTVPCSAMLLGFSGVGAMPLSGVIHRGFRWCTEP